MRLPAATLLALLWACGPAATPPWHQEQGYRWRDLVVPRGQPGFTSLAGVHTGIIFANSVSDTALLGNRMLGQGAGVALGDVDGDGLVDIFLAKTEGCNALYRNLGGWRFEDIAAQAGVAACNRRSSGAAFADTDGDGDLDLVLLSTTGPDAIFLNDGHAKFTEHRADLGIGGNDKGGTTITMADVDGDGDLDLYVANYKPFAPADSIPPQQMAFSQVVRQVDATHFEVRPEYRRDFKIIMNPDGKSGNLAQRGEPDDFYLNEGGHFTRVPLTSGRFTDRAGKALPEEPESFGLGARFTDLNGDGAPDLYVVNDFEGPDELWINDGHGGFRQADWTAVRQTSNSGMGLDVADVNGDGLPDLFEVDMLSRDTHRRKTEIPTHAAVPKPPGDITSQPQMQRNTLMLNRGDGSFGEIAAFAGVESSGWSWSTMFMDVDLDGWEDILVTTGHLWDIMDADVQERIQNRLMGFPWQRFRWQFPALELPNLAFRNRGNLTFEDAGARWGFGTEADISHTMAAADLDGDGDLDVIVNRLGKPALVLRNNAPANRVAVRLTGAAPNTQAVGAVIRVTGGPVPVEVRQVTVGGLYMSHSDYLATFATGKADSVTINVTWRDGRRTVLRNVRPDRLYEISDSTAVAPPAIEAVPLPSLFVDASAQLGGHRHVEPAFDDWERQFLLPNALSQLGPGVTWFDVDRDGDEDLLVGTGRSGRLGVFRNDGGTLRPMPGQGPIASADLTTILGLPSENGARLLLGLSTWEAKRPEDALTPAVLSAAVTRGAVATSVEAVVPTLPASTGPMALADYDGDGDLDLFVGGRVLPARYPIAAASMLFHNEGGRFVPDSINNIGLEKVGLVSQALFADVDGDGDPDLLLAREWNSILLLLNDHGRFQPAPDSWGLARWTGRWNGVAAGDLDGDGRLDLVATSWGGNTSAQADSANPLVLVHGSIGTQGEEETLVARNDPRVGGLTPMNGFARTRIALAGLIERLRTFSAYADASLDSILGPLASKTERLPIVTLNQMAFLNRGDHFEARMLPAEAQFAPASYAGIADFDGDGHEDVFLSQNFYPTATGIPRYDQGRSLLLLGDGTGALQPVPGQRSGLLVYGDQRGAAYADFDGDGRLDLAVSQNGAETKLFRNATAKPGLRVRVQGPAANPDGIGTQLRIVYGERMGPVREIEAGSGYWSENGAVQVFGLSGVPTGVWVRWPGGTEQRVTVPAGAREVVVRR